MYYIYKIENIVNNKKYIGLTNNIARRRARHFTDLKCNRHDNSFLQKEFNIYGKENFTFSIIFEGDVSAKEIGDKEKYYINFYDSYKNGYNQNQGGNFGPSNGGSHLTQSDIFNILAALEFMSRPGQVLSDIYEVSRATISRIKRGVNHSQYKEEYYKLSLEERKNIYNIFCESADLISKKANSSKLKNKRLLTKEQVFLIYLNEELGRLININALTVKMGVNSSNTIYGILKKETYLDYYLLYQNLTQSEKDKLATLLRKQYRITP